MAVRVVVHIINEEPFVADMEDMPELTATHIVLTGPRSREGNRLNWVTHGATRFIYPLTRIAFLEVINTEAEPVEAFFTSDQPYDH